MSTLRFGQLTAHFTQSGSGPDLILLHAGGSSGAQWRKVGALLDTQYRLTVPDFIGFGKTDTWPGPGDLSHDDQALLIASLIADTCSAPVHIVGHSYGGAVAVRLALAHPELLDRLVLIEPVLTPLLNLDGREDIFEEYRLMAQSFMEYGRAGNDEAAWRGFIDYRNGKGVWAALPDKAREKFRGGTRQAIDAFISNLANRTTLQDCRTIEIPTLILCGEKTTEPDRQVTEILRREMPRNDYRVIGGAEHMSPLTHPDAVASLILSHVGQIIRDDRRNSEIDTKDQSNL